MKEKLKKMLKALWSKPVLAAVIIALAGALGYELSADDADRLVCLFRAAGCYLHTNGRLMPAVSCEICNQPCSTASRAAR